MRVWKATMPAGASYGQEAYLTRNSGILLLLRPCPKVHLMVKKAEWKNGVGRYLEDYAKTTKADGLSFKPPTKKL